MNNILSSISFNNINVLLIGHKEWGWTPLPAIDSLKIKKNKNSKSKVHIGEL